MSASFAGPRRLFPFTASRLLVAGRLALVLAVLSTPVSKAASGQERERPEYHGVVVEEVGDGSALGKAGLQPGDVLHSWERLAGPPANLEVAQGDFQSPFDWLWVQIEQAPRGKVILKGTREGEEQLWTVESGIWAGKIRPAMSEPLVKRYLQRLRRIQSGQIEDSAESLQGVAETDKRIECWMLLRLGEEWAARRAWREAQDLYQEALRQADSPLSQVAVLRELGRIFAEQSDFDLARDAYNSALHIGEAQWGESLNVASIEAKIGNIHYLQGDIESARKFYRRSLAVRERLARDSLDVARSLISLGNVAWEMGQYEEAQAYYQHALEIQERLAPNSLDLASSYNNLGVIARALGRLQEAELYYRQDLEILKRLAPDSLAIADSYNNLGNVAWERFDIAKAEAYHQRALTIRENLAPESLSVADSYINLGLVARARSDFATAESHYQRALDIQRRLAPDNPAAGVTFNNLGIIARDRGDFEGAEACYQRALAVWKKLNPESLDVAVGLNNLGVVALDAGKFSAAEEYHLGALAIRQRLLPNSRDVASSLHNLGGVALARGELAEAASFLTKAVDIEEKLSPGSLELATTFNDLGGVAWARGDLRSAKMFYERGLGIVERLAPNSIVEAQTLHQLGGLFREDHEPQHAEKFFSRAINALEHQIRQLGGSYNMLGRFRAQNEEIYRDHIEVLLELGRQAEAFHSLELYRARALLELLSERDLIFAADISEELDNERRSLAFRYDQTLRQIQDDPEQGEKLAGELRGILREREELIARIRRESPGLANLQYPTTLRLEEVQEILEPGTSMLSYSVGEDQLVIFCVSRDALSVHSFSMDKEELSRMVAAFLANIERGRNSRSPLFTGVRSDGQHLYEILIEPVIGALEASDRLIVLPDGVLHRLPFGALIRTVRDSGAGRDWQYLTEWKPIGMVLSATLYAELQKRRRDVSNRRFSTVAAFGNPSYVTIGESHEDPENISDVHLRSMVEDGIFEWEPLPYTRQEVLQVARLHRNIELFVGKAATEEQIKSIGKNIQILHLATHSYLDDQIPLNSAVILSIPEKLRAGQENGLLQSWEIFEDIRMDADLVVLSACQSAIGEEQGGEGLIGLTRAFQYAGARSVVASLWSVADQTTAELMIRFYGHLHSGLPKDEALRAAQIELIRGPIEVTDADGKKVSIDASAPYYWAAFQVYGDWQ